MKRKISGFIVVLFISASLGLEVTVNKDTDKDMTVDKNLERFSLFGK